MLIAVLIAVFLFVTSVVIADFLSAISVVNADCTLDTAVVLFVASVSTESCTFLTAFAVAATVVDVLVTVSLSLTIPAVLVEAVGKLDFEADIRPLL